MMTGDPPQGWGKKIGEGIAGSIPRSWPTYVPTEGSRGAELVNELQRQVMELRDDLLTQRVALEQLYQEIKELRQQITDQEDPLVKID